MSAEPDFDQIYRLLGVEPDQGWEALRSAYRQRVQALHPDKVTGDPEVVREARQRFEQLNAGYRELRRYRGIFGTLPPTGLAAGATPQNANREWPATATAKPRRSRKAIRGAALLLVAAAIAWFVLQRNASIIGWWSEEQAATPTVEAVTPTPWITVGTTLGQVIDIQGQPDRADGDVWYYGDSTIVFESGRVAGWVAAADRPLRTATVEPQYDASARLEPLLRESFRVGSSKADVSRIQGQPLRAGENEWDYGVSKVYFEDGQVVGWYSSPIDPLQVRGPDGRD